jgi:uncharacterized protein (DUF433 family)
MTPATRSKTNRRRSELSPADLLSRREAATLAEVPLRSVNKAIEDEVMVPARSRQQGGDLDRWDVLSLALIARMEIPLAAETKRRINEWVHGFPRDDSFEEERELRVTDLLFLRVDADFGRLAKRLADYLDWRERHLKIDPAIQGGEPVIAGTRLPVRSIGARLQAGDTLVDLAAEYPEISASAFEAARIYAESHPRRGRPARPWRDEK